MSYTHNKVERVSMEVCDLLQELQKLATRPVTFRFILAAPPAPTTVATQVGRLPRSASSGS